MEYITYIMTIMVVLNGEPELVQLETPDPYTCRIEAEEIAEKAEEQKLFYEVLCFTPGEDI